MLEGSPESSLQSLRKKLREVGQDQLPPNSALWIITRHHGTRGHPLRLTTGQSEHQSQARQRPLLNLACKLQCRRHELRSLLLQILILLEKNFTLCVHRSTVTPQSLNTFLGPGIFIGRKVPPPNENSCYLQTASELGVVLRGQPYAQSTRST